jgi:Fe-S-cluster containining protein
VAPGFLGVGDLDRLQIELKIPSAEFDQWAREHLAAGDGRKVAHKGTVFVCPVIVPQQTEAGVGHCVFFMAGECSVHKAAPIGCSHLNQCEPEKGEGPVRLALLEVAEEWLRVERGGRSNYVALWNYLAQVGRNALPTRTRNAMLSDELERVRKAEKAAQ